MKRLFITLSIFSYLILSSLDSSGQSPNFYLQGAIGYTTFWGDISPSNSTSRFSDKLNILRQPKFGVGFNFGYQFTPVIGGRFNLTSGQSKSSNDVDSYLSEFTDISGQLTVDLTNLIFNSWQSKFNVYGFVGAGIMFHNSEQIKKNFLFFPGGIGIEYHISDNFAINFESTLHYSSSDMLEGIGSEEPTSFHTLDGIRFTSVGIKYIIEKSGKTGKGDGILKRNIVW